MLDSKRNSTCHKKVRRNCHRKPYDAYREPYDANHEIAATFTVSDVRGQRHPNVQDVAGREVRDSKKRAQCHFLTVADLTPLSLLITSRRYMTVTSCRALIKRGNCRGRNQNVLISATDWVAFFECATILSRPNDALARKSSRTAFFGPRDTAWDTIAQV